MSSDRNSMSADRLLLERLESSSGRAPASTPTSLARPGKQRTPDAAEEPATRPTRPIRIMIVDDQVLIREAIVGLIDAQPDMQVVAQASTLREALALAQQAAPDLVLCEFALPDGDAPEVARQLIARRPETRVVLLSARDGDECLFAAFAAGAVGYLLKSIHTADLLSRLRGVMQGEVVFSPRLGQRILARIAHGRPSRPASPSPADRLTEREREILGLLVQGHTNRGIADSLKLSVRTIEYHRANLASKLGLHSRAALIHYAVERRLDGAGQAPATV